MDIPATEPNPMKLNNLTKPIHPIQHEPTDDSIIIQVASGNLTTGNVNLTTTTTIKPKLRKMVKKKLMRLIRASEKPIFLRQDKPDEEEISTVTEVTETTTNEIEIETEADSTNIQLDQIVPQTIENSTRTTTTEIPLKIPDLTGYIYNKPTIQFDTPEPSPSIYYDNDLIPNLNKFVPIPQKGYGYSTNNKIDLISLTTSSYPPFYMNNFKPSSPDTFQNGNKFYVW